MRTTWLVIGVLFFSAAASAHAEESMLHKLLCPPPRPAPQGVGAQQPAPASLPAEVAGLAPVLPPTPIVVPPAGMRPKLAINTQSNNSNCCDRVGLLRGFLTSGHAFFQMPTGFGFCGLH
jgi:hypothetical protein